ncbi:hypothetical protein RQP46_003460 [Phenoliferia psychrophenolica]
MESCGAAMVLKLSALGKEPEWAGILAALGTGKVTLCLPAEKLPVQAMLTPAFFLDHLAVIEPSPPVASTSTAAPAPLAFATLSGFRGAMETDAIAITSCGTAIFESSHGLFKPGSLAAPPFADYNFHLGVRGAAIPSPPTPHTSTFPYFSIVTPISELSVPRTSSRSTPAVSSERRMDSIGRAAGATSSRLAALFGSSKSSPILPALEDLPPIVQAPPGLLSPSPSFSSASSSPDPATSDSPPPLPARPSMPNLELSVLGIDKIIRHADVARSVGKALEIQLRESLRRIDGLEDSSVVADSVCAFANRFQPPLGWTTSLFTPGKFPPSPDSLFTKDITDVSDACQHLLLSARDELVRGVRNSVVRERAQRERPQGERDDAEDSAAIEERVDNSLEEVERVVTVALYDRIFSPHSNGDGQADENLSSRIAALNILELSLDHLGIDLAGGGLDEWNDGHRTIRDSLEDIVGLAGKELGRLQDLDMRSPAAKLAVFVNIHKIIVEGLSKLPNIPLKETTDSAPFSVRKSSEDVEVEMDDAAERLSRAHSLSGVEADDSDAQTPRPASSTSESDVPTINLPTPESSSSPPTSPSSCDNPDLASSMHEAMQDSTSVFDVTPRRPPSPAKASSSSADLILPLLIYLVVQYNPPRLPSTLAYVQRFRSDALMRGEASYCLTNVLACAEFLNSVDISALGLSSQNIVGGSSPSVLFSSSITQTSQPISAGGKLKGRVNNVTQELDQFVDNANSAIATVVDSSFRMLFGAKGLAPKTIEDVKNVLDGAGSVASKARGTLLRRSTDQGDGFAQREMIDYSGAGATVEEDEQDDTDSRSVRSVRSVSSFLRDRARDVSGGGGEERPSIGERLASIASLQRFGGDSKSTSPAASSPAATPSKQPLLFTSAPPVRRATFATRPNDLAQMTSVAPIQRFMESGSTYQ